MSASIQSEIPFPRPSSIYILQTPNSGLAISLKGGFENNMKNLAKPKNDMNIGPNQFLLSNSLTSTINFSKRFEKLKPKGAINPNRHAILSKLVILTNE